MVWLDLALNPQSQGEHATYYTIIAVEICFNVMYCYEYVKIVYTVITLYITLTSIILLRMSDCKNTQTSRTSRFCKYLSLIVSHVDIQLEMYKWMNSEGNSTAWNKIKITCLSFVYWKVLTNQRKVIFKTFKLFK